MIRALGSEGNLGSVGAEVRASIQFRVADPALIMVQLH
jgi:hypothetical protein